MVSVDPEERSDPADILRVWRGSERVHFFIPDAGREGAIAAGWASTAAMVLQKGGVQNVSACVRPGVFLTSDPLAYQSVLRVTDADFASFVGIDLDTRIGSASVHFWPGSGLLNILTERLHAPLGLFLIVRREDIGAAKVWLHASPQPRWKIVPSHPLNDLEAAEFDEMTAGIAQ